MPVLFLLLVLWGEVLAAGTGSTVKPSGVTTVSASGGAGAVTGMPEDALLVLPFDGNATPGEIVTKAGTAPPTFVAGRTGQAIYFSDESAVAVPVEIDPRITPHISITAWIKRSPSSSSKNGWLIDSGSSSASLPSLRLSNGKLAGRGGRDLKTMSVSGATIPADEWTFIAGVWDFTARTMQLYKGDQFELFNNLRMDLNASGQIGKQKEVVGPGGAAGVFVTIGAVDFINFGGDVNGVAIDDVRIYKRALSTEEITMLAGGGASVSNGNSGDTSAGITPVSTDGTMIKEENNRQAVPKPVE